MNNPDALELIARSGVSFIPAEMMNGKPAPADKKGKALPKGYTLDQVESYTLDELDQQMPMHILFRDTDYIGVDIDIDKSLSDGARKKIFEDEVIGGIFKQFDGYLELSRSKVGIHAIVKDATIAKELREERSPVKMSMEDTGFNFDIELFGGHKPFFTTTDIIADGFCFIDADMPKEIQEKVAVLKPFEGRKSSTERKTLELEPAPIETDKIEALLSKVTPDKDNNFVTGYPDGSDPSKVDLAMAHLIVKVATNDTVAVAMMETWMNKHRPNTNLGSKTTPKEIQRGAKMAIAKALGETKPAPASIVPKLKTVGFNDLPKEGGEVLILDGIPVPETGIVMFVGDGDVGKSFITLKLAIEYLIQHPDERALFWFTEDEGHQVRKRIKLFDPDKYITNRMDFISSDISEYTDEDTLINELKELTEVYGVTVLDPLISFFRGNENDNSEARVFANKMKGLNGLVFMIHHSSKGGSASRGASDLRNSGRIMYQVVKAQIKLSTSSYKRRTDDPEYTRSRGLLIEKDNSGTTDEVRPDIRSDENRGYMLTVFPEDAMRTLRAEEWLASATTELNILKGKSKSDIREEKTLLPIFKSTVPTKPGFAGGADD